MTRQEVLDAINRANRALDSYKSEGLEKYATMDEKAQIEKAIVEFMEKRGYALGAAGNVCPRCNGSGRT